MDRPVTPLRATSFAILLVALWLIVLGIGHTLSLYFIFQSIPQYGLTMTYVTVFLIALWKMSPVLIGLALFRQHRHLVRLFRGAAITKYGEQNTWNNTPLLATLSIGLLGVYFLAQGVERFCAAHLVMFWIFTIDNPQAWHLISGHFAEYTTGGFLSIIYSIVFGLVFVMGAGRFGNVIGNKIDKLLENPSEESTEEEGTPL
jgi:hypothetical protein